MKALLADCSASISELKKNPISLLDKADGGAIEILKYNEPVAYLVPAQLYELLMDQLDDCELAKIVESRRTGLSLMINVDVKKL
ncbi:MULTISPECIES: type II toxin-antitoxin system prevent-host-death family antitoxin [unclassified Pseudoalteromonas]|uniref:type II toxin-antitoxin system prevent-host-death family antitoxin n=1 Tax=unclassified Pseudoalteromonas TaxID=194690 RepID=UPI0011096EC9|nr:MULTISPECIES: type II toxin-antitoxin system prevent-host-death family antitoxin [unclassified Pseudoalteromonas]TMN85674.1 antitoxin [Pseudoalteromonas sp. S410]TMN93001.1 antitoxin [Pseudoalteromonas sp. S408]TMN99493.1 antitoxin [Pseudoalteromonas sp. S407]TMO00269.1 antitoxin [Pseudoalteromonas sp. S409]TMO07494.1 antitoxin [Pseudoalteromonas sp. S186]